LPCGLATAAVMALLLFMARSPVLHLLSSLRFVRQVNRLHPRASAATRLSLPAGAAVIGHSKSPARPRYLFFVVLGTHANNETRQNG